MEDSNSSTVETLITLWQAETLSTPAGTVRVIPAREWFFKPD